VRVSSLLVFADGPPALESAVKVGSSSGRRGAGVGRQLAADAVGWHGVGERQGGRVGAEQRDWVWMDRFWLIALGVLGLSLVVANESLVGRLSLLVKRLLRLGG
jgi:hypothetical protein